jgi:hypothetical protein
LGSPFCPKTGQGIQLFKVWESLGILFDTTSLTWTSSEEKIQLTLNSIAEVIDSDKVSLKMMQDEKSLLNIFKHSLNTDFLT